MSKPYKPHDWARTGRVLIVCALIAFVFYLMAVA
jgi:hypothetical protein